MRYQTHVISSVTAAVLLSQTADLPISIGVIMGVAAGSLLPDVDEPQSYIGRRTRGLSDVTKGIFGHRGFTHSILAIILMFIPYLLVANPSVVGLNDHVIWTILKPILFGIGLGYALHIAGDMLSKSGVPLFLPISKMKIKIYLYKTGGKREMLIRYGCIVGLLYMLATGNVFSALLKW